MLFDLHTDFSRGRSGGLVFPSLEEFPQVVVTHTVKGFGVVSKAEDVFLELSCFFSDPMDVDYLSSGFLCLFSIQLEHLEVHGSRTVETWLREF